MAVKDMAKHAGKRQKVDDFMTNNFVLKGNICYSENINQIISSPDAYLICEEGKVSGVFEKLPEKYQNLKLIDYGDSIIMPGLVDLHVHAPQYPFRGLGMDLELIDWLNAYAFKEESKYSDLEYAQIAYSAFTEELRQGPNTRACVFATIHKDASILLMDLLENSGLVTMVGKVNMDRNSPPNLCESTDKSITDTLDFIDETVSKNFVNTTTILTPRFVPACTDELLNGLSQIKSERKLPLQSHISESREEIKWVNELTGKGYADAYDGFGLLTDNTVMAHLVWPEDEEINLIKEKGVYVAHCPQSNFNLASGLSPARKLIERGVKVGLGSDVAGGCHTSIFRAMSDAIQASKMYKACVDETCRPLSKEEAFYLGTAGGGSFFGNVGSFKKGFEFDAIVIDDSKLTAPFKYSLKERVSKIIYFPENIKIKDKYVRGRAV